MGTYTFANGINCGNFKKGKKEGSGILYYIDGTFEEGKWKDDSLVEAKDQVNVRDLESDPVDRPDQIDERNQ